MVFQNDTSTNILPNEHIAVFMVKASPSAPHPETSVKKRKQEISRHLLLVVMSELDLIEAKIKVNKLK